jgi:hypothetical protein
MILSWLLRAFLFRRLFGGRRRSRGYGGRRGSGGFRFVGPFPTYSTRTRRGSNVSVSGCCLPIPLALAISAALGVRAALRR